jgi:hypothetical protein
MVNLNKFYYDDDLHEYYYDGLQIPSVTQVLQHSRYIDYSFVSDKYRNRGSFIHAITELVDCGIDDYSVIPAELIPFVSAYELFIAEQNPIYKETETPHIGEINGLLFGGTPDRLCKESCGDMSILDIKTGHYTKWHPVQLAAYSKLYTNIGQFYNIYLMNNGDYRIKAFSPLIIAESIEIFKAALYKWWFDHKREWNKLNKIINRLED